MTNDTAVKIARVLHDRTILDKGSIFITTKTMVIAYRAKEEQIFEVLDTNPCIEFAIIVNCIITMKIFQLLFNKKSRQWQIIDLSRCDIADEGCEFFSDWISKKNYSACISTLNLSHNNLTSSSVKPLTKLLTHFVVTKLIIAGNAISNEMIVNMLYTQRYIAHGRHRHQILNFQKGVLLEVNGVLNQMESNSKSVNSTIYLSYNVFFNNEFEDIHINLENNTQTDIYYVRDTYITDIILSLASTNESIAIKGIINQKITNLMPLKILHKLMIIYQRKCLALVDFSLHLINDKICNIILGCVFNGATSLRHVSELDLSGISHVSFLIDSYVKSLQYCIIERTKVCNTKALLKLEDAISKCFNEGQNILNFKSRIPLTVVSNDIKPSDNYSSIDHVAHTYVNHFTTCDDLMMMRKLDLAITSYKIIYLNCLGLNLGLKELSNNITVLLNDAHIKIMIYEIGLKDEVVMDIVELLNTKQPRVQYILGSTTMLYACGVSRNQMIHALENHPYPSSITLTHYSDEFEDIWSTLSRELKHIKRITIQECNIYNITDNWLWESQSSKSMSHHTSYIRVLDLSNSSMPQSYIEMIVSSFQSCIIENVIVSDSNINDQVCHSIFLLAYNKGNKLLNFSKGIPIVIICSLQGEMSTSFNSVTAFLANTNFSHCMTKMAVVVSTYKIANFIVCLFQNVVLVNELEDTISGFQPIFKKLTNFSMLGIDLMDEPMLKVTEYFINSKLNVQFFLTSQTKRLCKMSNTCNSLFLNDDVMSAIMQINSTKQWDLIDLSGCNNNNEELLILQTYFSHSEISINYFDLSHSDLSSEFIASAILNTNVQDLCLIGNNINESQLCSSLATLLQHSIIDNNFITEIKFNNTQSKFVFLHELRSDVTNFIDSVATSENSVHLFIVQCEIEGNLCLLDIIVSTVNRIPHLSTLLLHNSGMLIQDIIKVMQTLVFVNLFIDEHNLKLVQLTENVSEQTIVYKLSISNLFITTDLATSLAAAITNFTTLEQLMLLDLVFSDNSMEIISKALKCIRSLKHLVIDSISILQNSYTNIDVLLSIVANNNSIEYFNISNCNLKETETVELTKSINLFSSLREMIFNNIKISDFTAGKLASTLKDYCCSNIENLSLKNTHLQESGVLCITSALKTCKLQQFSLSHCTISNMAASAIVSNVLKEDSLFSHLELSNCRIQEVGMHRITLALKRMSSLCALNLKSTMITNEAAINIADMIVNNPNIGVLKLSACGLLGDSIVKLFLSCSMLKLLKFLDLSFGNSRSNKYIRSTLPMKDVYHILPEEMFYPSISILDSCNQITHLGMCGWTISEIFTPLASSSSSLQYYDVNSRLLSFSIISSIIKNNCNLRYIDISKCALKEWMIYKILQSLSSLRCLEHLNISGNGISNSAANLIAVVITYNKNIQHLDLSNCHLQCNGFCNILDALKGLKKLLYFNVSYNNVSEEVGNKLAKSIVSNNQMTHLCLCHCDFYGDNFLLIAESLVQIRTLKHLDLSYTIITEKVASVLKDVFISNIILDCVNVSHCWIAEQDITTICTGLAILHSIKHLDFSSCALCNLSVDNLASALSSNKTLQYLDLSNCHLWVEGVIKILQALKATVSLKHLNLNSNCIQDVQDDPGRIEVAVQNLAYVIRNNTLLEHFEISNSMLLGSHIGYIAEALSGLLYLQCFNISHNEITDKASLEVASVITNNTSLECLNISHCSMNEESICMIANALLSTRILQSLNISNNLITERSAKAMYDSVNKIDTLKCLNFSHCCSLPLFHDAASNQGTWLNIKLTHIDLESTIVSDQAAAMISCFLGSAEYVNLSSCNLKETGLVTILTALKEVSTLQYLNLGSNKIPNNAGCILCNVVCINQNLQHLILPNCHLSPVCIEQIIKEFKSVQYLDISHNAVTWEILRSLIDHSIPLQYLNVNDHILDQFELYASVGVHVNDAIINKLCDISSKDPKYSMITAIVTNFEMLIFAYSCTMVTPMYSFTLHHILNDTEDYTTKMFSIAKIEYFGLFDCSLQEYNLLLIFKALKFTKSLCYLILNSIKVIEAVTDQLALIIENNNTLIHVSVSNCKLFGEQTTVITKAFSKLTTLQYLDISSNQIDANAATELSSVITNNTSLEYLNISDCNITEDGLQSIFGSKIGTLKHLDIARNELSHLQVLHYISLILSKPTEYADFSFNSKPVTMLSNSEKVSLTPIGNNTLQHLDLSHCKLPDSETSAVLLALSKCASLIYLNLSSCVMRDNAALLECIIANNGHLNYLNLSDCKFHQEDIIVIVNALRYATSVEHLLLNSNVITDKAAMEISFLISQVLQLKQLALSDCELEEIGIQCIATALQQTSSLQRLDLSFNIISDAVAAHIASALSYNTSLEYLDMSYCTWPNNGLVIISKSLNFDKLKETDFTSL